MLIKLALKYFFHNKKRTYIAVFILGITLSMIMGTNLLLTGFTLQISNIVNLNLQTDTTIDLILRPQQSQTFDQQSYNEIIEFLHNHKDVNTTISSYEGYTQFVNDTDYYQYKITDFELLLSSDLIMTDSSDADILISDEIQNKANNIFPVKNTNLNLEDQNHSTFVWKFVNSIDILLSEQIFDFNDGSYNTIEIIMSDVSGIQQLKQSLHSRFSVTIEDGQNSLAFIDLSVKGIIRILNIFQVVLSILLIISIAYIMISIVIDSEEEIKILNMIGMEKKQLLSLFLLQSLFISLAAFIFASFLSIIGTNILVALLSTTKKFSFLSLVINYQFQLQVLIQTLIIGTLSGIPASIKVIQ